MGHQCDTTGNESGIALTSQSTKMFGLCGVLLMNKKMVLKFRPTKALHDTSKFKICWGRFHGKLSRIPLFPSIALAPGMTKQGASSKTSF